MEIRPPGLPPAALWIGASVPPIELKSGKPVSANRSVVHPSEFAAKVDSAAPCAAGDPASRNTPARRQLCSFIFVWNPLCGWSTPWWEFNGNRPERLEHDHAFVGRLLRRRCARSNRRKHGLIRREGTPALSPRRGKLAESGKSSAGRQLHHQTQGVVIGRLRSAPGGRAIVRYARIAALIELVQGLR